MDDNTLMKISLTIALVGLFILFFISENIPYQSDLNTADVGGKISLKGKVTSITEYNNSQIIELLPYSKTKIVLFDKKDVRINDSIEVTGKVDEYKGRKEIIAEEVRKI